MNIKLTQNRNHHVVLHYLHRTIKYIVNIIESVSLMDEILAGCAKIRFNMQRQQFQATLFRQKNPNSKYNRQQTCI